MYYVYGYKTPVDIVVGHWKIPAGEFFYIGKGKEMRSVSHLKEIKVNNYIKSDIIKKIKNQGALPKILILENDLSEDEAFRLEKDYIFKFGRLVNNTGFLSNLTLGGEGSSGYKHSEDTKKLFSEQRKGKSPANKGKTRKGIGGRPKGIPWSKETREKIEKIRKSDGYYDYTKNLERRKKISNSKKGCRGPAKNKSWYNNGIKETYSSFPPEGFFKGRLKKITNGKKGLLWYTDGLLSRQFKENMQPQGWYRGRIIKKH